VIRLDLLSLAGFRGCGLDHRCKFKRRSAGVTEYLSDRFGGLLATVQSAAADGQVTPLQTPKLNRLLDLRPNSSAPGRGGQHGGGHGHSRGESHGEGGAWPDLYSCSFIWSVRCHTQRNSTLFTLATIAKLLASEQEFAFCLDCPCRASQEHALLIHAEFSGGQR
jgi:hypothetical protein